MNMFTEIVPGVFQAEKQMKSGWGLNMTCVQLPEKQLLIYSPTWLGDSTFEEVEKLGTPSILMAPNHFHYMSMGRFHERYPNAKVVASELACKRLHTKGVPYIETLEKTSLSLPDNLSYMVCEGSKTGETFLTIQQGEQRLWLVCDAFFNVKRDTTGMMGFVLRTLKTTPGMCIGQTFLWLGLKERATYRQWLETKLKMEAPTMLIPSHGVVERGADLAEQLLRLASKRLG
jgi:hypothetical protein